MKSCNTTFAELGLQLGEQFPPHMAGFGIYEQPPLDLSPGAAVSTGPQPGTFNDNKPLFALAGIGQGEVATTPLQMALVASAVANGGIGDAPARRGRDPRRRGPSRVDDQRRSRGRPRCRRPPRRRSATSWSRS